MARPWPGHPPVPAQVITTMTGSVYEIDGVNRRIRRLSGKTEATAYFGGNGWREFESLGTLAVGEPLVIRWERDKLPAGTDTKGHVVPGTVTSPVRTIEEKS